MKKTIKNILFILSICLTSCNTRYGAHMVRVHKPEINETQSSINKYHNKNIDNKSKYYERFNSQNHSVTKIINNEIIENAETISTRKKHSQIIPKIIKSQPLDSTDDALLEYIQAEHKKADSLIRKHDGFKGPHPRLKNLISPLNYILFNRQDFKAAMTIYKSMIKDYKAAMTIYKRYKNADYNRIATTELSNDYKVVARKRLIRHTIAVILMAYVITFYVIVLAMVLLMIMLGIYL